MAAILYKRDEAGNIETCRVNARNVSQLLGTGLYRANRADFDLIPTEAAADTNATGVLSNREVRMAAKEAGIDDWKIGRIARLKRKLGYDQVPSIVSPTK